MRSALLLALAGLSLTLLACDKLTDATGLERQTLSCDLRDPDALELRDYCQEWRGLLVSPGSDTVARNVCATLGIELAEGPCPDEADIVGGCSIGTLGDGSESYWWFYAPMTAAEVQAECEGGGDTYVDWTPVPEDER